MADTPVLVKQPAVIPPAEVQKEPRAIERVQTFSLAPRSFTEAQQFARMVAESDLAPKDFKGRPGNVLIALQMGAEVGLAPMAALQNIAVINGRPSIWGDAALAIVMAHRDYEFHNEKSEGQGDNRVAICEIKRKGHDLHTVKFSVEDAKKARLWGKEGPWTNYPNRMLQLRARGWAIRDKFSDALRGLNIGEEMQDIQVIDAEIIPASDPKKDELREEIEALLTSVGLNAANRMALISANQADLPGCLEALKTIKLVLTSQSVPVQQWPALLQKFHDNIKNYATELKAKHEAKTNGNVHTESAGASTSNEKPAEPSKTGPPPPSGESRPAGQDPLFVSEEETKPKKQPVSTAPTGRFTF